MGKIASGFTRKGTMYFASPADLKVKEGFNPRFDLGDLEALAASIAENGVKIPLRVRRNDEGDLEVVDGHRRLAAIFSIKGTGKPVDVPVMLIQPETELDALAETLISNDGKPLLPMEEAAALKRLKDGGLTVKDIMKKIGRSDTFIFDRLRLLEAEPEVQAAVAEGKIPVTMAAEIAKQKKERQAGLAKKAETKEGRKEVKKAITKPTGPQVDATNMIKAAGVAAHICLFLDSCNINDNVRDGARMALMSALQAGIYEGDPNVMLGVVMGVELAVGALVVPDPVPPVIAPVKPAPGPVVSRTKLVKKMITKKQPAPKKMTKAESDAQAMKNSAAIQAEDGPTETVIERGPAGHSNIAWPLGQDMGESYLSGDVE